MEGIVDMGADDGIRQAPNVYRMKLLGATVVPVTAGSRTLKDALNEALRDWAANVDNTFYIIGTAAGPHPYPMLVRDFQKIIGEEAKAQAQAHFGALPDAVVACVGGGSNAIGLFYPFYNDPVVRYGYMRGSETVDYVRRILGRWEQYSSMAPGGSLEGFGSAIPQKATKKYRFHL